MVVLAASIITKTGKALVSRQFVDMSRVRIEGLLAAFPKLVGIGKQHTYVETENVRYVYQPMEALYILLVTNKQSNILEDLETLRVIAKTVPEYAMSLDEEGICKTAFELIFAFDEVIALGHKENVTVTQVKQYCEMESHEERLHKMIVQSKINDTKDVMKRKASEIDKSKIEKGRSGGGGIMSLPSAVSSRIESFNDMGISNAGGGYASGPTYSSMDLDTYSTKTKGRPSSAAVAPSKGLGMQLGKTQKANHFLESLKAEGEVIVDDVQPYIGHSKAPVPVATDPITITVEEKLNVALRRDGGLSKLEVQGALALLIQQKEDGFIQVQIETGSNNGFQFKTHPNINKELFSNENILGLKDPNRPFPAGTVGDGLGVELLKWRMQTTDEALVPLNINCWPSVSGGETYVNIEYEASKMFDLQNVIITIPLPALRDPPSVNQIDGEWRYDSRRSILEWSILLIDSSNPSGSMEFVVPRADAASFFPINVTFSAAKTFYDIKVTSIIPLKDGAPPKYAYRTQLIAENFQVV
eukprot:TRINITY_DN2088_c0_g1_i2.p1 TRINITY_DN2088_c0_g1~~TRINITY_DN2088_c0_g1_i2.p1  ORF type:complete len:529 (+),score=130.01 TRINITY_DN2088_c0_g1_i2:321-1907(+)